MENSESPTKISGLNQSMPLTRNILKELNNLEETIKSPKDHSGTEDQLIHSKELTNLSGCVAVTSGHSGTDKVSINKNLQRASTCECIQAPKDEHFKCNQTFEMNKRFGNVSIILNRTTQLSQKEDSQGITSAPQDDGSKKNFNRESIHVVQSPTKNLNIGERESIKILNKNISKNMEEKIIPSFSDDPLISILLCDDIDQIEGNIEGQSTDYPLHCDEEAVKSSKSESIDLNQTVKEESMPENILSTIDALSYYLDKTIKILQRYPQNILSKPQNNDRENRLNVTGPRVAEASMALNQVLGHTEMPITSSLNDPALTTFFDDTDKIQGNTNISGGTMKLRNLNQTSNPIQVNEPISNRTADAFYRNKNVSSISNQLSKHRKIYMGSLSDECSALMSKVNSFPLRLSMPVTVRFPALLNMFKYSRLTPVNYTMNIPTVIHGNEFHKKPSLGPIEIKQNDLFFGSKNASTVEEIPSNSNQSSTNKIYVESNEENLFSVTNKDKFRIPPPSQRFPILFSLLQNSVESANDLNESSSRDLKLNSSDFDFLQSRGENTIVPEDARRSSLLRKFDPLAIVQTPLPVQNIDEAVGSKKIFSDCEPVLCSNNISSSESTSEGRQTYPAHLPASDEVPTSTEVVESTNKMDNEANAYVNNIKIERNKDDGVSLNDKKIKLGYSDGNFQQKMEEYETSQELLLKRITEKDKAIAKTSNVIELYEKAIAEALAAKEKLSQSYEKTHEELKTDRDLHFQHLLSLESTFSDLHMKFERNVQYTTQLQEKLNAITDEKIKAEDSLKQQELRYDKMKSHATQQFDIANSKLEQQTKTISLENTKLKAQIKREEIHKTAVQEELMQKKKENDELVKICDELISGQRS